MSDDEMNIDDGISYSTAVECRSTDNRLFLTKPAMAEWLDARAEVFKATQVSFNLDR